MNYKSNSIHETCRDVANVTPPVTMQSTVFNILAQDFDHHHLSFFGLLVFKPDITKDKQTYQGNAANQSITRQNRLLYPIQSLLKRMIRLQNAVILQRSLVTFDTRTVRKRGFMSFTWLLAGSDGSIQPYILKFTTSFYVRQMILSDTTVRNLKNMT